MQIKLLGVDGNEGLRAVLSILQSCKIIQIKNITGGKKLLAPIRQERIKRGKIGMTKMKGNLYEVSMYLMTRFQEMGSFICLLFF